MIKIEGKGNIVKAEIMGDEVTVLSELTCVVMSFGYIVRVTLIANMSI